MIDFEKLRSPEAKANMEQRRKEREVLNKKRDHANKFMASKLMEMVENDKIDNEFDEGFIRSVHARIASGCFLTDKQEAYLEKCFHHKY